MLCRLCLKLTDSGQSIFIFSQERIHKCITKFLHINLPPEDPISEKICTRCWEKLESFQKFSLEIEQAQKTIEQSQLDSNKIPTENFESLNSEISLTPLKEEHPEEQSEDDCDNYNSEDVKINEEEDVLSGSITSSPNIREFIQTRRITRLSTARSPGEHNKLTKEKIKTTKTETAKNEKEEEDTDMIPINQSANANTNKGRKCDRLKKDDNNISKIQEIKSEKYEKHMKTSKEYDAIIQKHMKLSCEICSINFSDFTMLKNHFRVVHKQKEYVFCCNKRFNKRGLIVDHINVHDNPEYFKCTDCGKVLSDRNCLQRHVITSHSTEELKKFQCTSCPEKFSTQYLLHLHNAKHAPMKFTCSQCEKGFPTNYTLNEHIKRRHSTVYDRMCEICAKLIRGKGLFERHMEEHEGKVQPQAQCKECGSWLKNKNSLRKHIYSKHDGKTHICDICGKNTPSKSALYSHKKYVHQQLRNFHCTFCDKSFKKAVNLKEHTTIHTGEVLYTCPHCPTTFNAKANMHSHRKKMHREEWEATRRYDKKEPNNKVK